MCTTYPTTRIDVNGASCGAKAGMIGMVRAMALDIADGRKGTCA